MTDTSSTYEYELAELKQAKNDYREAYNKSKELEEDLKSKVMSGEGDYSEKANIFLSNGMIPPSNPDNEYFDNAPLQILVSKVLDGEKTSSVLQWWCVSTSKDYEQVNRTVRIRHPSDYMKGLLDIVYTHDKYQSLLKYLHLPKTSKILGMCKSPHSVLYRIERLVSRTTTFKEMEKELDSKEEDKTKIALFEMKFKRIDFDIEELSSEFGKYKRSYERYLWLISEYPSISDKEAAEVCGVTTRQIRRYRQKTK